MLKKTITYTDYNGNSRTEDFYFNLSKAEVIEMNYSKDGGFESYVRRITQTQDNKKLLEMFKEVILMSYGIKSDDGKRFIKSKEISDEFAQTEAFSELYIELATNSSAATDFVNGISPVDVSAKIDNAISPDDPKNVIANHTDDSKSNLTLK